VKHNFRGCDDAGKGVLNIYLIWMKFLAIFEAILIYQMYRIGSFEQILKDSWIFWRLVIEVCVDFGKNGNFLCWFL
jgi:hypothetical protein